MSFSRKKVRPSSASGILQSCKIPPLIVDNRPHTSASQGRLGYEPTFLTAKLKAGENVKLTEQITGKQVHGGIDKTSFKEHGRRATVGSFKNLPDLADCDRPRSSLNVLDQHASKIEDKITLEHLNKMKQAFEEADQDSSGTLDLEEFKNVFRYFLGVKGANDHEMTALFMKIDSGSKGEINWDEFCTYMQLEYTQKEESHFRAKETAFHLPATMESSPHREMVLRITHASDGNFIAVGQDGLVSFWSSNLQLKRSKQVEAGTKKTKWITDFILMPPYNKFIIATGDREIQFHELSSFEAYCQISSLESVPLKLDYCSTGVDECILAYGDSEGCISIFIIKSVGELLRLWKKMPKLEGIASVSIDSVSCNENVRFIRWKVHNDWVQDVRYVHSMRSVISSSSDMNHSLVIGQAVGSTHVESSLKELKKNNVTVSSTDLAAKRRLSADETVFKIYKGVKTFDFSKTKNILVTGGMDCLVRLWNPYVTVKPIGVLRGHVTPIFYLTISPEDDKLFSVSNDKTVKVWDIYDQACLLTVRPKSHLIKGDLSAVYFNPSSRSLAFATDHMSLLCMKSKPSSVQITTSHKEAATCCRYNRSFGHVVTASEASVVKVWNVSDGSLVFEYSKAHGEAPITCMAFDSTERRLISGGMDGKLKIWNYNNGHCLRTLEPEGGLTQEVSALVYFLLNKNRCIISVGWDRRINIYSDDQQDIRHVQTPFIKWPDDEAHGGHKEDILAVAVSPPAFLATASFDGEILVWNITSGRILCRLRSSIARKASLQEILEGGLAVHQVQFLHKRHSQRDAASLVSAGPKAFIHFWNVFDPSAEYASFSVSKSAAVTALAVSSDSRLVYTGDSKGFVFAWDVSSYCLRGKECSPPPVSCSWRAHVQMVTCLELMEEHRALLTASVDCTVRVWTDEGHFIGTFGQPNRWDIYNKGTYQHPMAPYDVLVDPDSLPDHPVLARKKVQDEASLNFNAASSSHDKNSFSTMSGIQTRPPALDIEDILRIDPTSLGSGKRLRHARLQRFVNTKAAAYKSLKCFELDEVPPLPEAVASSDVDGYKL